MEERVRGTWRLGVLASWNDLVSLEEVPRPHPEVHVILHPLPQVGLPVEGLIGLHLPMPADHDGGVLRPKPDAICSRLLLAKSSIGWNAFGSPGRSPPIEVTNSAVGVRRPPRPCRCA